MTHHLGHEKHSKVVNADGNTRNGMSKKTLKGKNGSLPITVPRDRDGSFEPQLVKKIRWDTKSTAKWSMPTVIPGTARVRRP
jgi:transposase-like protein